MKNGEIVTLDKVTGKIILIRYWDDGTKLVRFKHKDGKNSDHIVMADIKPLRSRYDE